MAESRLHRWTRSGWLFFTIGILWLLVAGNGFWEYFRGHEFGHLLFGSLAAVCGVLSVAQWALARRALRKDSAHGSE